MKIKLRIGMSLALVCIAGCSAAAAAPPRYGARARMCDGGPELESAWSALASDVDSVEPLRETAVMAKVAVTRPVGIEAHVRATPGMTEQWLARVAECHLARGGERVEARVMPEAAGFALDLRTDDPRVAAQLQRRGTTLFASPDAVPR